MVEVRGGVTPHPDYQFLHDAGVAAVFGPGARVSDAARKVVDAIREKRAAAGRRDRFLFLPPRYVICTLLGGPGGLRASATECARRFLEASSAVPSARLLKATQTTNATATNT